MSTTQSPGLGIPAWVQMIAGRRRPAPSGNRLIWPTESRAFDRRANGFTDRSSWMTPQVPLNSLIKGTSRMTSLNQPRTALVPLTIIVSFILWAASGTSACAGSFRGDMLVADFSQSAVLAFDPSTGAYQGVFANLGFGHAQTLAEGPIGNVYVTFPNASKRPGI
jgi:hypothetical protein